MSREGAAPRISLCMIVRDEAPILARCLEAAKEAVDEIVVVDTGSRDDSPEIARSFGALVFPHPWNDDFAEARNVSLDRASGKWALWLDADEVLQPGGAERIREAVSAPQAAGFYLHFTNVLDGGRETHYLMPRLFLRRPEVRFVNVVHEQILGPLESYARARGLSVGCCDARVVHFGYLEAEMERKGKRERTLRLFAKQLSLFPDDPYSWYKFGDFVRSSDREEGVRALRKSFDLIAAGSAESRAAAIYAAEVGALLATELQASGRPEEADAVLDSVPGLGVSLTPNFYFGRACVARERNDFRRALQDYEACLGFAGKSYSVPVQWGVCGPLALLGIAVCRSSLGENSEAESAFRKALDLAPHHLEILLSFATFLFRQQRFLETLELLLRYLARNPERSELWERSGAPILQLTLQAASRQIAALTASGKQP